VQKGFIDRFGRDPRRLQLLFLSQCFSNGALVPFGGHGTFLWGPRADAEQTPKLGIFIDEQGATSVESLLKRHGS